MKNIRLVLFIIGTLVALGGVIIFGYPLLEKFRTPAESPFKAIPGNTALIFKLNKAGNLLEELNRSNLLWRELSRFPGVSTVRGELQVVDSASRKNARINEILQHFNIYIAISLSGWNTFGSLYLTNLPRSVSESDITDFVVELSGGKAIFTESPYATTKILRVQPKGSGAPFYFGVLKGVFMGSYHADLVKKAIDRLSLNTPMASSYGFQRVESTTGKKVDANIYVNYRFFSLVLSKITRTENLADLIKFSHFADWSGLDLIIKKDELLFNGFTVANDSSQHFLALFSEQKPQKVEISRIIPQSVSYFTFYGWSDPAQFVTRLETRLARDENYPGESSTATTTIERFQLSINDYFIPWLGNESCLFVIPDPGTGQDASYAAFRAADTLRAVKSLLALADTIGVKTDSVSFNGTRIYRCPLPDFLPLLFGDLFTKINIKCFALLDGYLIFAGNQKELEYVIQSYRAGDNLIRNREYLDFSGNLSAKSTIFCYFNTQNAMSSLRGMLNLDLREQLNPVMDSIRKFESVAFQYNNQDGLFYSNVFLRYDPNFGREGPLEWQTILDTTIAGRPQIINTSPGNVPMVVVTDTSNTLYLVGADGHIAWKKHIMGTLRGEVNTILLPGSDSSYLLFNTETHLYLIRSDGQFADKYPMRFPLHATNPLTYKDYAKNRNYIIYVAFHDNRLYSFTLDGKSQTNWNRPNLKEEIILPATIAGTGSKAYILIRGRNGHGMIVGRDGTEKIVQDPQIVNSPNSGFYANRTGKKGLFLTTNLSGKAVFIQGNGKTSEVTMNLFSPDHRFFYEDITGSPQPEFIYVDKSRIYYYNRNYKLVYSYAFRREVNTPPFLLHTPDGKSMIGFVVPETNELFLFDKNGYRELESGIRGNTPFNIGKLNSGDQLNLVVGSGKTLKNFRLPKLQ